MVEWPAASTISNSTTDKPNSGIVANLKYLHFTLMIQMMVKKPSKRIPVCLMTGCMKFPLLYDSELEAEYTSTILIIQRKKNTIQMTLSPLNILPIILWFISFQLPNVLGYGHRL